MKRLALAAVALFAATTAAAQERILSYDIIVEVKKDATIEVTENIAVRAEGSQIRRGIYRDFPTRYRDRMGNRVRVGLDVLGVEKNGVTEPWFTENLRNGVRINTGNDDFLPVPADYTYTIRYRTTRQLGFFANHDELYWNAIGTGWVFPIEKGTVEVRLPAPVPVAQLKAEAYTGPQGAQGTAYVAETPAPGIARYRLTSGLGPYEGFTIVLSFPKGLIPEPTQTQRVKWLLQDNRGILIALAGLVVLLVYMFRQWSAHGRDPQKGIIIARYEPSEGHTPAGLRYLQRMGYDMRCFTGDVLALAVAGRLRIHEKEKIFKNEWQLERVASASSRPVSQTQNVLLETIFRSGNTLVLKNTNAATMSAARDAHTKRLQEEYQPRYFNRNGKKVGIATLIAIASGIAAFVSSGGFGVQLIVVVLVLMLISLFVFGYLIKAPTREGRALLDEIEGLRLYLSVAERDELKSMKGPNEAPLLDAARYETLLPFAVALEVEDAWTKKFTQAAGAAAAAEAANSMPWYSGRGPVSNLGDFSRSIGSSLSSTISSASTPPGSSSGSGGGGSSGGGGGGGGGGGR